MESGKYRTILIVSSLFLLVSICLFYLIQIDKKNAIIPVSVESYSSFINIEGFKKEIEGLDVVFVENNEFDYRIDDNFKEIIANRNIFGLRKKVEEEKKETINEVKVEERSKEEKTISALDEERFLNVNDKKTRNETLVELTNPFYLQGVSINLYDKMAIIINKNNFKTYLIKPGMIIDGYLVKSISFDEIVMEKDGQKISVEFRK